MSEAMQAGRELDALVAEKVMGKTMMAQDEMAAIAREVWREQPNVWLFWRGFRYVDGRFEQDFPHYSTDIAAAWKAVEGMTAGPWYFEGTLMGGESVVSATAKFVRTPLLLNLQNGFQMVARTMPEAICLAALAAVGAPAPAPHQKEK